MFAQAYIHKTPTSALGYLASGAIYIKQNNSQAALDIYRRGLRLVPKTDSQYHNLQKEERVLNKLHAKQRCGFYQRLPYDTVCQIFGLLSYNELLQCAIVCQEWTDFLLAWPKFWSTLSHKLPQIQRSTWISLIRREAQELNLHGSMLPETIHSLLMFLIRSNNRSIRELGKFTACINTQRYNISFIKYSVILLFWRRTQLYWASL